MDTEKKKKKVFFFLVGFFWVFFWWVFRLPALVLRILVVMMYNYQMTQNGVKKKLLSMRLRVQCIGKILVIIKIKKKYLASFFGKPF